MVKKQCRYCQKEVTNEGTHITTVHKDKLPEYYLQKAKAAGLKDPPENPPQNPPAGKTEPPKNEPPTIFDTDAWAISRYKELVRASPRDMAARIVELEGKIKELENPVNVFEDSSVGRTGLSGNEIIRIMREADRINAMRQEREFTHGLIGMGGSNQQTQGSNPLSDFALEIIKGQINKPQQQSDGGMSKQIEDLRREVAENKRQEDLLKALVEANKGRPGSDISELLKVQEENRQRQSELLERQRQIEKEAAQEREKLITQRFVDLIGYMKDKPNPVQSLEDHIKTGEYLKSIYGKISPEKSGPMEDIKEIMNGPMGQEVAKLIAQRFVGSQPQQQYIPENSSAYQQVMQRHPELQINGSEQPREVNTMELLPNQINEKPAGDDVAFNPRDALALQERAKNVPSA